MNVNKTWLIGLIAGTLIIIADVVFFSKDKIFIPLNSVFINGEGKYVKKTFIEWKFKKNGYEVEVYLTEPPERQIRVFEILKSNKKLLKEYEDLKVSFDRKSYKDYQKAKYEFYNRILSMGQ